MVCPLRLSVPCEITSAGFTPSKFRVIGRVPRLTVPLALPLITAAATLPLAVNVVLPLNP